VIEEKGILVVYKKDNKMGDLVIGGLILLVMCGALCWYGVWALRKGINDGLTNKTNKKR